MKAILEFDLDNPDDIESHLRCVNADKMAEFIWELQHNFWREWKHDDSEFNLETYKEALSKMLEEYNINPDEFWR